MRLKTTMNRFTAFITGAVLILSCWKCGKEDFYTAPGAVLSFSTDTVSFDTIFSSIGSTTLSFKVYNPHSEPVKITTVYFGGGENSFYRMNFDGESGRVFNNIEIPPKDSLFVFIEVTIDPLGVNNPFIVKDSIIFITNGTYQDIKLIAYGQDVHLIDGEIIKTATWSADKPYLIINSMAVDSGHTLTIGPGTQVFLHDQSSIAIWGKILVNGTKEAPVIFQGDRLEEPYRIVAGQWGTIYIDPSSTGNVINYAIIRNSIAGIQIGLPTEDIRPSLDLSNTVIQNVSYIGIYAFGAEINCYNTIVANSGDVLIALLKGGKYNFSHCTFANKGVSNYGAQDAGSRSNPSVVLTNFFNNPEFNASKGRYEYVKRKGDLEEATFNNTIIYGTLENELFFVDNEENDFNYYFNTCLLKENPDSIDINDPLHYNGIKLNRNPEFVNDTDRFTLNYRLDTLSPAKDSANADLTKQYPWLEFDYDGNSRLLDNKPDLGAFERKEN
jgi:hypothetical protein